MEVAWVEGWALPPEPTYDVLPDGRPAAEARARPSPTRAVSLPSLLSSLSSESGRAELCGRAQAEADRAAWGRLGFPNGAVCTILAPPAEQTAHPLPAGPATGGDVLLMRSPCIPLAILRTT
jgi:hypothetical protein